MVNEYEISSVLKSENERKTYVIEYAKPSGGICYHVIKRLFDIFFSVIGGILALPFMIVIAVIIKIDSPGSVIYKQERLGKDGRKFAIWKFRTMNEDAEKDGPKWADTDDGRCTKVGAVLRGYRLDELPQLWNIFIGHMSVVGPRPERECFYEEFEKYIHGFRYRLEVKPGLTGHAQVNGGYELKPEEKIIYDMQYVKCRNIRMDLKIIFKTIAVIFRKEGAK